MGTKNPDRTLYSVDQLMLDMASTLIRDFQSNLGDELLFSEFLAALRAGNIAAIRDCSPTLTGSETVAEFKATYQIQSIFKRHRFLVDTYSDEELSQKAISAFEDTQRRIRETSLEEVDTFTTSVLATARTYITQVLGKYDDEEHRRLCRFGRRASVGIPSRLACEAARWELPLTGSQQQISWFDSEMSQDAWVQDYWNKQKESDPQGTTYQEIDTLMLTLVPKTFKSLRAIMPNSTIGSYMSFGLGEMIRKRLRRKGFDIKSLQQRHRILAQRGSIHGMYVTADLSSASDSISVALVRRLFPPDWLEILEQSRIGKVLLPNGSIVESETFCTMGIGYTFPLQTLVFLALLKAIEATMYHRWNCKMISVYGDDMIYSSKLHQNVISVFGQLGFVLNVEKTFSSGSFRESCGGDYYRGVDVRPFQPRNGSAFVGAKTYEAVLYKILNGLLRRWSEYEIGRTLSLLTSKIEAVVQKVKLVPGDYPDDSGVKCPNLRYWDFLQYVNVAKPVHIGSGRYRFSYLRVCSKEREENRHEPYYWQRLRGYVAQDYHDLDTLYPGDAPSFSHTASKMTQDVRELVSPLIRREVKPSQTFRGLNGRRYRREKTYVTISHTGRYVRRSGVSGFETAEERR